VRKHDKYPATAVSVAYLRYVVPKSGGSKRPEQFPQMRAPVHPADQLIGLAAPAGRYTQALQAFEIGRDAGTHMVGPIVQRGFRRVDQELVVDRQTQPHFVDRHAGCDIAAVMIRECVVLGVPQVAFDVPQAVVAAVSMALHHALVDGFAVRRR
jgi:hypothetical protein